MTQEEKQLLLKDLCARLPYGVKIKYLYWDEDKGCEYPLPMILDNINSDGYIRFHGDIKEEEGRGYILTYLPYLRPMSSMTEDEKKTYKSFFSIGEYACGGTLYGKEYEYINSDSEDISESISLLDWLIAHHFDYRGLIPMGLALEAPNGMYKTE